MATRLVKRSGCLMSNDKHLERFKELWYNSSSLAVWCQIYQHPLHRINPVILDYENLPDPFRRIIEKTIPSGHKGKTGDRVHLTPEGCFNCKENIRNGGICVPI